MYRWDRSDEAVPPTRALRTLLVKSKVESPRILECLLIGEDRQPAGKPLRNSFRTKELPTRVQPPVSDKEEDLDLQWKWDVLKLYHLNDIQGLSAESN
jgi:hypothetical protein